MNERNEKKNSTRYFAKRFEFLIVIKPIDKLFWGALLRALMPAHSTNGDHRKSDTNSVQLFIVVRSLFSFVEMIHFCHAIDARLV